MLGTLGSERVIRSKVCCSLPQFQWHKVTDLFLALPCLNYCCFVLTHSHKSVHAAVAGRYNGYDYEVHGDYQGPHYTAATEYQRCLLQVFDSLTCRGP